MGDAQKRSSLIKVLGDLIGHCGLDLILPRSRPLDGGPGRQLTNFGSFKIYSYQWSPDGKSLGMEKTFRAAEPS